jgi:M6 family metalloprotease-like protein
MKARSWFKVLSLIAVLLLAAPLQARLDCGYVAHSNPPGMLMDYHGLSDTVHCLVLWTTPDSTIIPCERWRPASYNLPPWADSLWDPTNPRSVTSFYRDNSNGKHLVTGESPSRPGRQMFVVGVVQGGYFDPPYGDAALDTADRYIDFSQYDYNHDGYVDQVILFDYNCDSRGVYMDNYEHLTHDGVTVKGIISIRIWQDDYRLANDLTCHEYGHTLSRYVGSGLYECITDNASGVSVGLADFDIMSCGGFSNQDNTDHVPSLFDPLVATGKRWQSPFPPSEAWATEIPIMTSQFGFLMQDYASNRVVYRLDADPLHPGEQFFYVTAHHMRSEWEKYYPSRGVLIWHVDLNPNAAPIGAFRDGSKRLDIEHAGGLYQWTFSDTARFDTVIYWGSDTSRCREHKHEDRVIGVSNGVPDPVNGIDSFDVVWVRQPGQPYRIAYEPGHIGSPSTFFRPGDVFDASTNPSSCFYDANGAQSIHNSIVVRVLSIDTIAGTTTADLIVGAWGGHIPQNVSWSDTIQVLSTVTVDAQATLSIAPGTKVLMQPGAQIIVNGTLRAEGTWEQNQTVFDCADTNQHWSGIEIRSNSAANCLRHVIIRHADKGVVVNGGCDTLIMSRVELCGLGIVWIRGNGLVEHCDLSHNSRYGAWIADSPIPFGYNFIERNGQGGVRIWRGMGTSFYNNQINNNGMAHDPDDPYWPGVLLLQGQLRMECNDITWNQGSGVMLAGESFTDMHNNKRNLISNNMQAVDALGFDYGQMMLCGGLADMQWGYNTIADPREDSRLVCCCYNDLPHVGWWAERNYWGTTNGGDILSRVCNSPQIMPILDHDYSWQCGEPIHPISNLDSGAVLLYEGWSLERDGLFEAAAATLDSLLVFYPTSPCANAALNLIEFCMQAAGTSWEDIRNYYLQLAEDSLNDRSRVISCISNAAWCLVEIGDYDHAFAELDSLMNATTQKREQLDIAVQRLHAELYEEVEQGSDKTRSTTQAISLQKLDDTDRRLNELLAGGGRHHQVEKLKEIPSAYALYQNYPNPFNPLTEIRFDLPEAARVDLSIYNVNGQLVRTLIHERLTPGVHSARFDGGNLPSGMYLYRLASPTFTQTRKMVLLK